MTLKKGVSNCFTKHLLHRLPCCDLFSLTTRKYSSNSQFIKKDELRKSLYTKYFKYSKYNKQNNLLLIFFKITTPLYSKIQYLQSNKELQLYQKLFIFSKETTIRVKEFNFSLKKDKNIKNKLQLQFTKRFLYKEMAQLKNPGSIELLMEEG